MKVAELIEQLAGFEDSNDDVHIGMWDDRDGAFNIIEINLVARYDDGVVTIDSHSEPRQVRV